MSRPAEQPSFIILWIVASAAVIGAIGMWLGLIFLAEYLAGA